MLKRFVLIATILLVAYVLFLMGRLSFFEDAGQKKKNETEITETDSNKVNSFQFVKYTKNGEKEIEIEGDSADIFAQQVDLENVIAKAYADQAPVTLTADKGTFDRSTSLVHLKDNVVATSEDGSRLLSESLDIHPSSKTVSTTEIAELKKDNIQLQGKGARGDSQLQTLEFDKQVRVEIQNEETQVPTVITCDGPLFLDYDRNFAKFQNNVVATDARGRLSSDVMDVYYDRSNRVIEKIIASGNVVIEQNGNVTFSDIVTYLAKDGTIILGGNPEAFYRPHKGEQGPDEAFYPSFNFRPAEPRVSQDKFDLEKDVAINERSVLGVR